MLWGHGVVVPFGRRVVEIAWGDWPSFGVTTIAAKELLPIVEAVASWSPQWRGHVVNCHCDN